MRAIKKINNNVAICVDDNKNELIAFGKGIGFPIMPYEIKDLRLISKTFYKVDKRFYSLIEEIPEDVFEVAALIVEKAQTTLDCYLNPNLVISLSDHINFAIIRMNQYKEMQMVFSYDVEQLYSQETSLGRYAVELIKSKLNVSLPTSEITNIAMHFVNAEVEKVPVAYGKDQEELILEVAKIIEDFFSVPIVKNSFNYHRFAMHLRYYLKRIKDKNQYIDDSSLVVGAMKEKNPRAYECAYMISNFIDEKLESESTEEEILYLTIHINRIINNANMND
ncbi:PRD domain-containing protein [Paraliobacillus zengyii]|uniref:PRD domain-containing protein n=1 Tax=Paraliobacillus zengyii TaxID=2213194 RepID=UPI000DD3B69F|nr:PRD domain-containing protein [Paraliobacillus zengyii]